MKAAKKIKALKKLGIPIFNGLTRWSEAHSTGKPFIIQVPDLDHKWGINGNSQIILFGKGCAQPTIDKFLKWASTLDNIIEEPSYNPIPDFAEVVIRYSLKIKG